MRHIFSATQLQNKDKRASMFSSKVSMQTLYEFFNAHVVENPSGLSVISGPSCRQPRRSALNFTVLAA
jgi:hypothetical protein